MTDEFDQPTCYLCGALVYPFTEHIMVPVDSGGKFAEGPLDIEDYPKLYACEKCIEDAGGDHEVTEGRLLRKFSESRKPTD